VQLSLSEPVNAHGRARTLQTCRSRFSQERVSSTGELYGTLEHAHVSGADHLAKLHVIGTPIVDRDSHDPAQAVKSAVPLASETDVDLLHDMLLAAHPYGGALVLTGAGCSTESNIPDYRGPQGAYTTGFKPMTHQAFMKSEDNRSRYWMRSYAGWHKFSNVQPNDAHTSIAWLQSKGFINSVITQNVDRLHHKAGSPHDAVLELHGTTHEVVCLTCKASTTREEMQRLLARYNASSVHGVLRSSTDADTNAHQQRPDGDVEVKGQGFLVPPCPACGGILKPDVVFFGDSVPKDRSQRALELAQQAAYLLVVGSSVTVFSAFRLVKAAKENGAQIGILNFGNTRADDLADWIVEARAGHALSRVVERLGASL
jgi:NAD-dependent deacetylase sirtuin 4